MIATALRGVPEVEARFLSGSHGNGMADTYSDLDFVLVSEHGATDAMAAAWAMRCLKTERSFCGGTARIFRFLSMPSPKTGCALT